MTAPVQAGDSEPAERAGLYAVESGPADAPFVVLVHGSMDRSSGLRAVARRLEDDLHVLLYDRRGYGRSRAVGGPFDIAHQVADLIALLDGRPAVVFGHSLGGDVALAAACRHPGLVRGVGAYEPPMSWEPWWPPDTAGGEAIRVADALGPEAAAAAFMRRMIGASRWERLPAATRAEREAEGAALVGELEDLERHGPPYEPDEIRVPVLVACGEHAAPQHRAAAEVLAQRFGVPARREPFEVAVVPGAGHGIHLDQPLAMAGLVRRLLAQVTAG